MRLAVCIALATIVLAGCYGRATLESCRKKYIVHGRGNGQRDYEECLERSRARGEDLGELEDLVRFETGCRTARLTPLGRTGRIVTTVGVEACGRRLVYTRQLRRHLGARTARNTHWELMSSHATE
jgi:hypothetical protein